MRRQAHESSTWLSVRLNFAIEMSKICIFELPKNLVMNSFTSVLASIALPLLTVIFNFIQYPAFSQEASCADFHNGVFYGYSQDVDALKWVITRSGNHQKETTITTSENDSTTNNNSLHEIIKWVDNCTYVLTYDPTYGLSIYQKFVNDCGGSLNKIIRVEGNCYIYTSTITYDGINETFEGKICKE